MAHRIAIVGTSGSGKTTLARTVAQALQIPHIELDALFWGPDWQEPDSWEFSQRVEAAIATDNWVVDGNYLRARLVIWPQATTIVWLNYSLPLILWRVTRRTITRSLTRQELWNGCYETFQKGFLSRDSIILYALQTHAQRRREFPAWFAMPQYQHLKIIELRSPQAAEDWVASLSAAQHP